jgi:hypothetical protein
MTIDFILPCAAKPASRAGFDPLPDSNDLPQAHRLPSEAAEGIRE